ncbi:MAG: serine/threonine-protein kinase, partial [Candidatus Hydrogenedentes bacterium]|nr:serine/threonine-protein kinase [Candidatus Hydrogenedentota bacterium]
MARKENTVRADAMFGDYEIIETIGHGGMGIVYRAHDMALGRIVALKVLKDDLRSSRQICARFQREAEAFASLNHPNIVHIYAVGSVGRIPFISMEYIEGQSLSTIMRRRKRLPWKRALHIAQQIAEALACAHEAQIVHRDIKPGNILLDKDDRAFVTDFGIAKVLTAETQLTVDGSRLGTPQYMSPERCTNKEITT